MWIRLATVALCLVSVASHAQAANDSVSGLNSCIQAARLADAICSKLPKDPVQRADCFAKARAAQLECLDRVLSEAPADTAPPASLSETTRPEPPVETAPPAASAEQPPASSESAQTDQPDVSIGSNAAREAAKLSDAGSKPDPASVSPPETAASAYPETAARPGAILSSETGRTGQPDLSVGSSAADDTAKLSDAVPKAAPATVPAADAPTGAIQSTSSDTRIDKRRAETDWIVSETTSPVDYSPLVTAVIRSTSNAKDGPTTLTVRCRARHTELSIRTDGIWGVRRGHELLVDQQINDRPAVRQPWILSADGRTASYKNKSVEFLQSIPDGATLKIAVADKTNARREAIYELTGLTAIRQKVGTACRWTPLTAKTSSDKP